MKQTLTALLIASLLVGCKKETPEPDPEPVHTTNYFTFNGTEVPISNEDTTRYWSPYDCTTIVCGDAFPYFSVAFPGTDTISYHVQGNANYPYTASVGLNSEYYSYPDIWIYVTEYGQVGGRVIGTFDGTMKKDSDTTVVINVSGAFNVLRGPNVP